MSTFPKMGNIYVQMIKLSRGHSNYDESNDGNQVASLPSNKVQQIESKIMADGCLLPTVSCFLPQSVCSKTDCLLKKKKDNFLIFQKRWSKRLSSLICKSRIVICCSGAKVNYLVWYSMQVFLLEISTWFNSKNKYWMNKYLFCTSKHSWLGNKCLMLKTQNPFWCPHPPCLIIPSSSSVPSSFSVTVFVPNKLLMPILYFLFTRAVFLRNTSYNKSNFHTVHQMPQPVSKLFIKNINDKAHALIEARCH